MQIFNICYNYKAITLKRDLHIFLYRRFLGVVIANLRPEEVPIFFIMEKDNILSIEQQEWRDIPWYEWLYQVSSIWIVKSLDRLAFTKSRKWLLKSIIMKNKKVKLWYETIILSKYWSKSTYQVHRLVAAAFLWLDLNSFTDHKNSLCVCHKDDNPSNNRLDNLFLGTRWYNNTDRHRKWRSYIAYWKSSNFFWKKWKLHARAKPVIQMTNEWYIIKIWDTATEAWNYLWINKTSICSCCNNKLNFAWWFKWSFAKNEIS